MLRKTPKFGLKHLFCLQQTWLEVLLLKNPVVPHLLMLKRLGPLSEISGRLTVANDVMLVKM